MPTREHRNLPTIIIRESPWPTSPWPALRFWSMKPAFRWDASYDSEGNLYRKHYDGLSGTDYEQWLYDSKNRVKYYRDRAGFVTLTERDAPGKCSSKDLWPQGCRW